VFFATSDASWNVVAVTLSMPVGQIAMALRRAVSWMGLFDSNFGVQ